MARYPRFMRMTSGEPFGLYPSKVLLGAEFFILLKELFVMKKLEGGTVIDGVEIQQALDPNHIGYSAYWLEKRRPLFNVLVNAGLLQYRLRGHGPRGYGDDELYSLTPAGKEIAGKSDDEILAAVHDKIMNNMEMSGYEEDI